MYFFFLKKFWNAKRLHRLKVGLHRKQIKIIMSEKSNVYITKANYKRMLRKIRISDIGTLEGEVFTKPIYFLSTFEKQKLLLIKKFLMDPENFYIEYYKPVLGEDTYKYVYETEQLPAYHLDSSCDKLLSDFTNFEIPFEIKANIREKALKEGKTEKEIKILITSYVNLFRRWFKLNLSLYRNEPEKFLKKLEVRWNVKRNIKEIERENSGIQKVENYSLSELEEEINNVLRAAGRFFNENTDKQQIIRRFQKLTFLAYTDKGIINNNTGLSDAKLKAFLKEYDRKFKKPVRELLIEYYRVKYNPDLSFEGKLLEKMNFKPCGHCCAVNNEVGRFFAKTVPASKEEWAIYS